MHDAAQRIAPEASSPILESASTVRHGFFGRRGGVSAGIYGSLNCGHSAGDETANVAENRARVAATLGVDAPALVSAYQVHSADVHVVTTPWSPGNRPKVDGMVSRTPGIALGILAADCGPVLFADEAAGIIGACHAGWRGALGGIIAATVDAMEGLGASREAICAALGPTIAQPSYEVGPEFPQPFLEQNPENGRFFVPAERDGHFRFDLPGYILSVIAAAGVGHSEDVARDTCAETESFFSYRRNTLEGESRYGRNISVIALAGA